MQDYEEIFQIVSLFQNVYNLVLYYLGVYIISGILNSLTFIIGTLMIIINILVLLIYLQSERESSPIQTTLNRKYNGLLENYIVGADVIASQDKVDSNRNNLMDILYSLGVMRANNRTLIQSLSIINDLTGLILLMSTSMFSIQTKMRDVRANIAGTAISLSNRLINVTSKISRDIATAENLMRTTVVTSQ